MTSTAPRPTRPSLPATLATGLINGILAVKPLASWAKRRARQMMVDRAENLGVPWREEASRLRSRNLEAFRRRVETPGLTYPDYYLTSFHAYDTGNLSWEAATEVEVAAQAVHARIWAESGTDGDARLRRSFNEVLAAQLPQAPRDVVDIGCSVGMSTFALQDLYPEATLTGVDLSPYFLAVAQCRAEECDAERSGARRSQIRWVHAAGEATGLPAQSCDLVTVSLVCHELPDTASQAVFREAFRLLRSGGHLAIMEMNPNSEVFANFPPYVLTLLKSTEPYLDRYFQLDCPQALADAGFQPPSVTENSPRHYTLVARKP